MSDLFGIGIPELWTAAILEQVRRNPDDRFYLLTKQPQNLIKFGPFPDNCWVGVTATNADMFADAIFYLNRIQAPVKYISFEPLLDWATVTNLDYALGKTGIKWALIGAQTKPFLPPKLEWVEEITRACDKAGIPVFHKDNLKPIFPIPTNTLRQEMPRCIMKQEGEDD